MKINHGWVIVATGIVVTCIGMGSMMSLGVFLQPIAQAMGWSRTGISTAATINFIAMGVGSMVWGAATDRFGARPVVMAGGLLLAAGLAAGSQAATLLQFQILFGVLVGLAAGSFYVPLTTLTAAWFVENRSLAVALVSAGLGLGSTVIGPLARWIIISHDWRAAMMVLAALALAVVLPAAMLLRPAPVLPKGAVPAGDARDDGMTVGAALRTPVFAAIALANFACCAAHSGPIFHMVSYAADCGVGDIAAATVFGAAGLASVCGRIVCGFIADRAGARRTLIAALMLQAFAISLYMGIGQLGSFYAVALVFGFSYGGAMPLYAILVRAYFPGRIMGTVFGVVAMISTFGMAIGPLAGGWVFDHFGQYLWLYAGSMAIGLSAAAIAWAVRPPGGTMLVPRAA